MPYLSSPSLKKNNIPSWLPGNTYCAIEIQKDGRVKCWLRALFWLIWSWMHTKCSLLWPNNSIRYTLEPVTFPLFSHFSQNDSFFCFMNSTSSFQNLPISCCAIESQISIYFSSIWQVHFWKYRMSLNKAGTHWLVGHNDGSRAFEMTKLPSFSWWLQIKLYLQQ